MNSIGANTNECNTACVQATIDTQALHMTDHAPGPCATAEGPLRDHAFAPGIPCCDECRSPMGKVRLLGLSARPRVEVVPKLVSGPPPSPCGRKHVAACTQRAVRHACHARSEGASEAHSTGPQHARRARLSTCPLGPGRRSRGGRGRRLNLYGRPVLFAPSSSFVDEG